MTPTTWFVIAAAGWIGIGVALAAVLGRRGFDSVSWFIIGMVLGPMALPIAWNCVRRDESLSPQIVTRPPGVSDSTGLDILVGVDGSPEAHAAINEAVTLFGDRIGRLTLVTVVPFDDAAVAEGEAKASLEAEAAALTRFAPTLELVHGHPATALAATALKGSYDVLVVGTTGAGHAHLFGSAAKELAHHSTVPVLLTGQQPTVAPSDASTAVKQRHEPTG